MIGRAGPLLAAIAVAALTPDGGGKPSPTTGAAKIAKPPTPLKLLRPDRPTPAQRVTPGLY